MFVAYTIKTITELDALKLIANEESHFFEHKAKEVSGKILQATATAFANSDGGEILIGIDDTSDGIFTISKWRGFVNQEEANQMIQNLTIDVKPLLPVSIEFYELESSTGGKVLHVLIGKSSDVHRTSDGKTYVRRGAQKFEIAGDEIVNLKLSKGLISSEDQLVNKITAEELVSSKELNDFLVSYSPQTPPLEFLHKQRLVKSDGEHEYPTYGAVLLYADNPSAILPRKCAIKIARYETSEEIPRREHLTQQFTCEGPVYQQISDAMDKIIGIIQSSKILVGSDFITAKYPLEAIKEILVNAVIHRDYNVSDDVLVFIFNNRIEIKNPGRLPGHITEDNIFDERFSRNPNIVRLLNKYPNPPNKDIGEGLNTAFEKMREVKLKTPFFKILENAIIVTLPHQPLASPEEAIIEYLQTHNEINNSIARAVTGIASENLVKVSFYKLRDAGKIERVPGKKGPISAWRLKLQTLP